ncbi:hypothetical protein GQ44DRAFT_725720 [Phaeosphaeriaceae sp. PMI808]|nr:hypothetical protein GQ44DRAFT_725720 [Phaeosphaeriaceae sp. PMI808]
MPLAQLSRQKVNTEQPPADPKSTPYDGTISIPSSTYFGASEKTIVQAAQLDERPTLGREVEWLRDPMHYNEYDTEIQIREVCVEFTLANGSPRVWKSSETSRTSTGHGTDLVAQEAGHDGGSLPQALLSTPLEAPYTPLYRAIDAILLIGYMYATTDGHWARKVLTLTNFNTVWLLQTISFSAPISRKSTVEQVRYVLGKNSYMEVLRLHDLRCSISQPVYRGFPIDEWILRCISDWELLEKVKAFRSRSPLPSCGTESTQLPSVSFSPSIRSPFPYL